MPQNVKPESQLKNLLDLISSYPIWLKETLYIYLRDDLKNVRDLGTLNASNIKDCLFLYEPKLARAGQNYLDNIKFQEEPVDTKFVEFLKSIKKQKNLVDIAQDNDWNLKTVCFYVLKSWEKNVILPTYSKSVYALVRFLAGEIAIGELLVRLGRITKEQLNWVLKMNKSGMMASFEEQSKGEDVLVNLGYVTSDELQNLQDLVKLSNEKQIVEDPSTTLVIKMRDLQKKVFQLEDVNNNLIEERKELEKKVKKLNNDLDHQRKERMLYHKEVEVLKEELKKALKS